MPLIHNLCTQVRPPLRSGADRLLNGTEFSRMMKSLSIRGIPYPQSFAFDRVSMRNLDKSAIEAFGIPSRVLMENAGRALAGESLSLLENNGAEGRRPGSGKCVSGFVFIAVCGGGNNGGDGLVALRHLKDLGHEAIALTLTPLERMTVDTRSNFGIAVKSGVRVHDCSAGISPDAVAELDRADLILDCILGTGSSGAPRGVPADAITLINSSPGTVVSADLPSGLDADTGAFPGLFVKADATVTFGGLKPGLLIHPGAGAAGRVVAAEIGIPRSLAEERCVMAVSGPAMASGTLPPIRRSVHKGQNGRVLVAGGFEGFSGAALMCALGALRSGAGLVTVAAPEKTCRAVSSAIPEAMTMEMPTEGFPPGWSKKPAEFRCDALAIGPGLGSGPGRMEMVTHLAAAFEGPMVIDADGLNRLAEAGAARVLSSRPGPTLLTPHPGEMARLLDSTVPEVLSDPLGAARSLAKSTGAVVHLKGATSVTVSTEGQAMFCVAGSPGMAKGGSGDLLTGFASGLAARGVPLFESGWLAAWILGRAAEFAAADTHPDWLLPRDTLSAVPRVYEEIESHRGGKSGGLRGRPEVGRSLSGETAGVPL